MADYCETRVVNGKKLNVFVDDSGNEYCLVKMGKQTVRNYFHGPAGDESRDDWCPACGGNHDEDHGTPGYSCSR